MSDADEVPGELGPDDVSTSSGRPMFYSPDGEPMTFRAWAALRDTEPMAYVVGHELVGPWFVSTVNLGAPMLDWSTLEGVPVLWETMAFGPGDEAEVVARYRSKVAAEAGHAEAVAEYRKRYGVGE